MKYKVVDGFNGFEDDKVYDSLSLARSRLLLLKYEFFDNIQNKNAICRLKVVLAESDWYFDPRYNKFIWG